MVVVVEMETTLAVPVVATAVPVVPVVGQTSTVYRWILLVASKVPRWHPMPLTSDSSWVEAEAVVTRTMYRVRVVPQVAESS